jgi:hypothetical protein
MKDRPICIFCKKDEVIKFGKTKSGSKRLKCKNCNKTWVDDKVLIERPEKHLLVEKYYEGDSVRKLVPFYHSSPQKINKTIRTFLSEAPNWLDYIDNIGLNKTHNVVYLIGQNFSCNCDHDDCNNNYLAIAVDAVSSFILSYEISISHTDDVWDKLISNLSERDIQIESFISKIDENISSSISKFYPESKQFTNVLKASRQKEINCYLNKLPIKNRLINDAIKMYDLLDNKSLEHYLNKLHKTSFGEYITDLQEDFFTEIEKRCEQTKESYNDVLVSDFKDRFEKFHMVKCEPTPLINGWIAYNMLKKLECGFSRFDYYKQIPNKLTFKDFSDNNIKIKNNIKDIDIKRFSLEMGTRLIQIPIISSQCNKRIINNFVY